MKTYLVGGAVRDQLLGLPVHERDWVVVGATPDELIRQGYQPVGRDFPVFLHPQTKEEYALARMERKAGTGYHGFDTRFSPDVTLEQDLLRRDLTINAIAQDPDTGELIDPYHGQRDLQARQLRHVSPAFIEDPLRVLRVARFAARFGQLGFQIAADTMALMTTLSHSGELNTLTPERVWRETQLALCTATPQHYVQALRDCGALEVLMPELDALFGVPQPATWHPEIDTGEHLLLVVAAAAQLTPDPVVRFAALLHDLGKGTTPPEQWPKHLGHEVRGLPLVEALCQRWRVPNEYRDLSLLVAGQHGVLHRALELRPETLLQLLEKLDALRRVSRFEQFLLACEADARGRAGHADRAYPQAQFLRQARAAIAAIKPDARLSKDQSGPAIAAQLRAQRLEALTAFRQQQIGSQAP